jgi:hypothetical protein
MRILLADRFADAPLGTHAADPFSIKQTVGMMVRIGMGCGRNLDIGNYRAAAYGLSLDRNQSVAKTESPQAGSLGRMSLGPGGCHAVRGPSLHFKMLRQDWDHCRMPGLRQIIRYILSEFFVELLAIEAGPDPLFRRLLSSLAQISLNGFRVGKNPGYDRQFLLPGVLIRESQLKNFQWSPMKRPDMFLILLKNKSG